jgi:hypothetical protein
VPRKKLASAAVTGRETAFPLSEDSRIVCKKLKVTGTRLQYESVCMAMREWDRMWAESARGTQKLQEHSTQPEGPK